jgi:hypothetical protein
MLGRALEEAEGDAGGLLDVLEEWRDPLLPNDARVLAPPGGLARVRLVLVQGAGERDVW